MGELADLHARVLAEPDDDAVRLVYADALTEAGDPRGELISAQLALAAAGVHELDDLIAVDLPDADVVRLGGMLRRVEQLLAQHRESHARELFGDIAVRVGYRRGMPHGVRVDAKYLGSDFARALDRTTVRALVIDGATLDSLTALAHAPPEHVTRLELTGSRLEQGTALGTLLAKLPRLESFELHHSRQVWFDTDFLIPLANLVELTLGDLGFDGTHVDALAQLPSASRIRSLNLGNCGKGNDVASVLDGRFPALTACSLRLCGLDAGAFASARRLQLPATLALDSNRFGDRGVQALLEHPTFARVEQLDLSATEIGDAGIAAIARSPHLGRLRRITLDQGRMTDKGLQPLAELRHLREISLCQTDITARGLRALLSTHALRVLDYWPSAERPDGTAIARAVAEEPNAAHLRSLELHACRLDDNAAALLVGSPHLRSLRALIAAGNHINNAGAQAIAQSTQPLVKIILYDNHLRDAGFRAWADAPLPALVKLDVRAPDPMVHAALAARFAAYFLGDEVSAKPGTQVLFSTKRRRVTPTMIRDALAPLATLALEGSHTDITVRDPAQTEARGIEITISHGRANRFTCGHAASGARAAEIRQFEGILTLAYRPADKRDLAAAIASVAAALVELTGGVVYDVADGRLVTSTVVKAAGKRPAARAKAAPKRSGARAKAAPKRVAKRKRR